MNLCLAPLVLATYKGEAMLADQETRTPQTLRAKPVVVLALLLLVVLQFTSAAHQFDHTANDLGDVCSFCLQLDRLDDISTADNTDIAVSHARSGDFEFTLPLTDVKRQIFSQPRAPPLS
jgi:hypothetical protein